MILRELGPKHDWPALRQALEDGEGPVALTLSPSLVARLEDSDTRAALKRVLDATGRPILAAVLDDADLPGWGRPYRAALAIGAAELLEDVNRQKTRAWVLARAPGDRDDHTAYLIRVAAFCYDLQVQTRRVICLALRGAGPRLAETLSSAESVHLLAGLTGLPADQAGPALARHLGLASPTPDGLALPPGNGTILSGAADRAV